MVLICISLMISVAGTFSCISWTLLCLLWKNVLLDLCPFLKCDFFTFFFWVVWVFIYNWILISYQIYDLQIFPIIELLAFSFCQWFPLLCRNFLVWCSPTVKCVFIDFAFGVRSKKKKHYQRAYDLCFLLGVLWFQVLYSNLYSILSWFLCMV